MAILDLAVCLAKIVAPERHVAIFSRPILISLISPGLVLADLLARAGVRGGLSP